MSLPSQSRISFARINENVRFTGGNFGINTTNPMSTLDVSGTARITTSITSGAVYATNSTVTNSVSTNISSGTLNLSTGLTAGTILATTSISSGAVNATNSTVTNSVVTSSTVTNVIATNVSSATLNTSKLTILTPDPAVNFSLLDFRNSSSYGIYAQSDSITARGNTLRFLATDYNTDNVTTRDILTMRPEGNIGINTSTPSSHLHVAGGYSNSINSTTGSLKLEPGWIGHAGIVSFFQANGTRKGYIGYGLDNTAFELHGEGSRQIILFTNDIERMTVTSIGNVGIGTTTPTAPLEVYNASTSIIRASGAVAGQQGFNITDTASRWSMYKPGNTTDLRFYDGTSDRVTFANGGNVGIGTTTPTEKLNVVGNIDLWGTVRIGANSSSAAFQINLGTTGVGSYRSAMLYGDGTNIMFSNQQNGNINFATNNTANRLVIAANGTVGVGTASPGVALHVKGNVNSTGQPLRLQNYSADSGVFWNIGPDNATSNMTIYNQNGLGVWIGNGGTVWNAQSDIRVKKDVETLTSGLDLIEQLRPVKYRYNQDDAEKSLRIGFIAQEVRDLIPEIVGSNPTEDFPDGLLGLSLESFVPFLVNAIKDLSTELKQTKSELQQTKSDLQQIVNDLLQRIEILENQGA